jgi:uncharacterized cupin superfamily protein
MMSRNTKIGVAFLVLVIITTAFMAVRMDGQKEDALDKVAMLEAEATARSLRNKTDVAAAYLAGVGRCTDEDKAYFDDLAKQMKKKMTNTSNPYVYIMYRYMLTQTRDWSQNWDYSDETLDEMVKDYMEQDVAYQ